MAASREYPSQPIVAVAAVVRNGDRVLLVRRGKRPALGHWSIPGGAVEVGETLREALGRELQEECAIEIECGELVETIDRILPDEEGRVQFHYVILDFAAQYRGGELCAGSDSTEARWVPQDELGDYGLREDTIRVIRKAMGVPG